MTDREPATARVSHPAELLVLLPYQLGYHPAPSVCVIHLHDGRMGMVQRLDAIEAGADLAASTCLDLAVRERVDRVILAAFEDQPADTSRTAPRQRKSATGRLRRALRRAARQRGVVVSEDLVSDGSRWWCRACSGGGCPPSGHRLPRPEEVPAVAEFVLRGVHPRPSRAALVASLDREVSACDQEAMRGAWLRLLAADPTETDPRSAATAWSSILDPRPGSPEVDELPVDQVAMALWSLTDHRWRDALLVALCPGLGPLEETGRLADAARRACVQCSWTGAETAVADVGAIASGGESDVTAILDRLLHLAARSPQSARPAIWTVIGQLAWWSGDGTVASEALERALTIDPEYRLAGLLHQLLGHGLRPPGWGPRAA